MKSYSEGLKKKLKNNFYSQFSQFENDIKKIHTEALEQGPKVTASQLNIEKVMNKLWSQGCNYIFKKMKNEINIQKKSNQ